MTGLEPLDAHRLPTLNQAFARWFLTVECDSPVDADAPVLSAAMLASLPELMFMPWETAAYEEPVPTIGRGTTN